MSLNTPKGLSLICFPGRRTWRNSQSFQNPFLYFKGNTCEAYLSSQGLTCPPSSTKGLASTASLPAFGVSQYGRFPHVPITEVSNGRTTQALHWKGNRPAFSLPPLCLRAHCSFSKLTSEQGIQYEHNCPRRTLDGDKHVTTQALFLLPINQGQPAPFP